MSLSLSSTHHEIRAILAWTARQQLYENCNVLEVSCDNVEISAPFSHITCRVFCIAVHPLFWVFLLTSRAFYFVCVCVSVQLSDDYGLTPLPSVMQFWIVVYMIQRRSDVCLRIVFFLPFQNGGLVVDLFRRYAHTPWTWNLESTHLLRRSASNVRSVFISLLFQNDGFFYLFRSYGHTPLPSVMKFGIHVQYLVKSWSDFV